MSVEFQKRRRTKLKTMLLLEMNRHLEELTGFRFSGQWQSDAMLSSGILRLFLSIYIMPKTVVSAMMLLVSWKDFNNTSRGSETCQVITSLSAQNKSSKIKLLEIEFFSFERGRQIFQLNEKPDVDHLRGGWGLLCNVNCLYAKLGKSRLNSDENRNRVNSCVVTRSIHRCTRGSSHKQHQTANDFT